MNLKKIGNILASLGILVLIYVLEYKRFIPGFTFHFILSFLMIFSMAWNIVLYKGIFRKKQVKWVLVVCLPALFVWTYCIYKTYTALRWADFTSLIMPTPLLLIDVFIIMGFLGIQIGISLEKSENTDKK